MSTFTCLATTFEEGLSGESVSKGCRDSGTDNVSDTMNSANVACDSVSLCCIYFTRKDYDGTFTLMITTMLTINRKGSWIWEVDGCTQATILRSAYPLCT